MARLKRTFGEAARLPSGRYRARYVGPDGARHSAPHTFQTKGDADGWLTLRRSEVLRDEWTPTQASRSPFGQYAEAWLKDRTLKPRTHAHYRTLLDRQILPTFGDMPLKAITPASVRKWHASMPAADRPTLRAHAYALLKAVLQTAVYDEEIPANPCHIRGAGSTKRAVRIQPASLDELGAIVAAMPARYRSMVLLASWCAMRFGEVTELRRKDVDLELGVIHVRRAVTRVEGAFVVSTPKSDAGVRDVTVPPHIIPALREHLHTVPADRDALLFPSAGDPDRHLMSTAMANLFRRAKEAAGRPDLRFHDLRHTGAVLAAQTGATLAELMGRLGHSTPGAAMRYQHAAQGRDAQIAAALSDIASGKV